MNKKELEAFAKQAAKGIKSEQDLTDFRKILTKITVEAALNAELEEHLGYALHEQSSTKNNRNGYSSKSIRTEDGQVDLETPRDREGSFERMRCGRRADFGCQMEWCGNTSCAGCLAEVSMMVSVGGIPTGADEGGSSNEAGGSEKPGSLRSAQRRVRFASDMQEASFLK